MGTLPSATPQGSSSHLGREDPRYKVNTSVPATDTLPVQVQREAKGS